MTFQPNEKPIWAGSFPIRRLTSTYLHGVISQKTKTLDYHRCENPEYNTENGKYVEEDGSGLIWDFLILLEELGKITKNLNQDRWYLGRNSVGCLPIRSHWTYNLSYFTLKYVRRKRYQDLYEFRVQRWCIWTDELWGKRKRCNALQITDHASFQIAK
jgi:hypothetical protein